MAMVIARGKDLPAGFTINIDDFDAALADASVMAISKSIDCALDADAERVSTEQSVGAKVTLTLQSGKTVEKFLEAPKGSASRPFTMDDHVARFRAEMLRRFAPAQVDALLSEVREFERAANADRLMQLLASRT
jgi:2-methylcitrate dehydratase PrpD